MLFPLTEEGESEQDGWQYIPIGDKVTEIRANFTSKNLLFTHHCSTENRNQHFSHGRESHSMQHDISIRCRTEGRLFPLRRSCCDHLGTPCKILLSRWSKVWLVSLSCSPLPYAALFCRTAAVSTMPALLDATKAHIVASSGNAMPLAKLFAATFMTILEAIQAEVDMDVLLLMVASAGEVKLSFFHTLF